MKKSKHKFIFLFLIFLGSCVDLEHVNTFSVTAIKTLELYPDINYSFSSSYIDYTVGKKLFRFNDSEFESNKFIPEELSVDTSLEELNKKADETISYFVNTLIAYFQGLSKISGKEFVNYNFDDLASNLKSAENVKTKLRISDQQIDAGANIAKFLADEIEGKYREKKLREILIEKDQSTSLVIDGLIQSLQILDTSITSDLGIIQADYTIVLSNPKVDATQKLNWKINYNQNTEDLKKESSKLELLIMGLKTIKEGHNTIVAEIKQSNKLDAASIIKLLDDYSTKIFNIQQQIKLLEK